MRNTCLIALCLLLTGITSSAQKVFTGYYIDMQGDSTPVQFTNFKQWEHNPQQIKVTTKDGKEEVRTPQNTRTISIDGFDTYESRSIVRLLNPVTKINDYRTLKVEDSLEQLHGFLLLLTQQEGTKLFKYSDKKRVNYFIEQPQKGLTELRYKVYMNEENRLVDGAEYRNQIRIALANKLAGDKKLEAVLQDLRYDGEKLKSYINLAYGEKKRKKKMYPMEVLVIGGGSNNTFEVKSNKYRNSETVKTQYDAQIAPVIGVGFIEYSQRNFARNFISAQLKYFSFKNTGTFITDQQETEIVFQSGMINLSVGLGRNIIQTPLLSYYAAIAPNFTYLPNSQLTMSNQAVSRKTSLLSNNLALQTGIRMKTGLGIWVHYNLFPTEVQRVHYFEHTHRSIQLGAEWRFKGKK